MYLFIVVWCAHPVISQWHGEEARRVAGQVSPAGVGAFGPRTARSNIWDEPVANQQVARRAGANPLSQELRTLRYQLLVRTLRRDGGDPLRATTFDRFGPPNTLGWQNRHGILRGCWVADVLCLSAVCALTLSN